MIFTFHPYYNYITGVHLPKVDTWFMLAEI